MENGLFKRIFTLYGVILFLAVIGAELFVTGAVRTNSVNTLRDSLAVQAALIAKDVPFRTAASLDPFCRQVKEAAQARITIIAADGRVLGDSDHDSATMDNHLNRLEVQQAVLFGVGMAVRRSDTLGSDLLYVARKIGPGDPPRGFVRLSVPLRDVDASINRLRIKIILAVTAVLLATSFFSLLQIDRLRRLTGQIRDFASAVARGDFRRRLFLSRAGEFDEIAEHLNAMSAELQRSIAASEEEKRRLGVILRNVPDALLITDANGVIGIANAASRIYFGEAALPGKLLIEAVRDREFLALLESARRDRKAGMAEFSLDYPEERSFSARVAPLSFHEGELSGFVAVFHEITRLKRLERVRQDFVANISHEIKTPITAIRGFADTLLEGALDDREHARKFLETIRENSRRINSLVDDLLTISKLELGVITVKKSAVRFEDVADTVLTLLRDKAKEKGLSLSTSVPGGLGAIMADRDRLIQILTNLVDNAVKFTETGGVTLGMAEEGGKISIFVEDTGFGIPEKHLPRLGERFYRVDTARSRKMGGTGLGLAIVKHLVKAHGWDMQIESTVEKGTKVRIFVA